jgi:hypothetical protein
MSRVWTYSSIICSVFILYENSRNHRHHHVQDYDREVLTTSIEVTLNRTDKDRKIG